MVAIYFSIRVQRKFSFGTKWIIFYDVEITRINDTFTQFSGKQIFSNFSCMFLNPNIFFQFEF